MQAFALPLFTRTALQGPDCTLARLISTGAAFTWFSVKSPATRAGGSETIRARSLLLDFLMPP